MPLPPAVRVGGPLSPFVDLQGVVILDGGLATELEHDGHDLRHPLWSAKLLLDDPDAIRRVHRRYLEAGADCIIAATYQATTQGLAALGFEHGDAAEVIAGAIELAVEVRDATLHALPADRLRPLVAASVGPYGAFLADGSEYRGDDGQTVAELRDFHAPRWAIVQASAADLVACETIPSLREVDALTRLFASGATPGWISVVCRDDAHLCDGTPVEEAAALVQQAPGVLGLGLNCTRPEWLAPLMRRARAAGFAKPFVAYPNSGEVFDGATRGWTGTASAADFVALARGWRDLGAVVIGGCCRTGPEHVAALRRALVAA